MPTVLMPSHHSAMDSSSSLRSTTEPGAPQPLPSPARAVEMHSGLHTQR